MGLAMEFHQAAHTAFESDGSLEACLTVGMGLLGRAVAGAAAASAAGKIAHSTNNGTQQQRITI